MGRGDQPAPTCRGCPSAPTLAVPEARTPSRPVPEAHPSRGHPKVAETHIHTQPAPSRGPRPKHPDFSLSSLTQPAHQRLKVAVAASDPES